MSVFKYEWTEDGYVRVSHERETAHGKIEWRTNFVADTKNKKIIESTFVVKDDLEDVVDWEKLEERANSDKTYSF